MVNDTEVDGVLVELEERTFAPRSALRNVEAARRLIDSGEPPDVVLPKLKRYLDGAAHFLSGVRE